METRAAILNMIVWPSVFKYIYELRQAFEVSYDKSNEASAKNIVVILLICKQTYASLCMSEFLVTEI